jgi:methanogenic corrinoid protein MtbC1
MTAIPQEIGTVIEASLRDAIDLDTPELFLETLAWAQTAASHRRVDSRMLSAKIEELQTAAIARRAGPERDAATWLLDRAREHLQVARIGDVSPIRTEEPLGAVASRVLAALRANDEAGAAHEVSLALGRGNSIPSVYLYVFVPILHEVGRLWQRNELTIPEERIVTLGIERLMAQCLELSDRLHPIGKTVACAAVGSASHAIAPRMLADCFTLAGWKAIYVGANIPVHDMILFLQQNQVDIVALSATLPQDAVDIRRMIALLSECPTSPPIIVGGHAFDLHPDLWRSVGASGYARSVSAAIPLANELVAETANV